MDKFLVTLSDDEMVVNEEELVKFVQVGLIKNKDVNDMTIRRIVDVDVHDDGTTEYVFA